VTGCCEYVIEPSDSIKVGDFLDQLSYYQLLKIDSALCSNSIRHTRKEVVLQPSSLLLSVHTGKFSQEF